VLALSQQFTLHFPILSFRTWIFFFPCIARWVLHLAQHYDMNSMTFSHTHFHYLPPPPRSRSQHQTPIDDYLCIPILPRFLRVACTFYFVISPSFSIHFVSSVFHLLANGMKVMRRSNRSGFYMWIGSIECRIFSSHRDRPVPRSNCVSTGDRPMGRLILTAADEIGVEPTRLEDERGWKLGGERTPSCPSLELNNLIESSSLGCPA